MVDGAHGRHGLLAQLLVEEGFVRGLTSVTAQNLSMVESPVWEMSHSMICATNRIVQ